jgi:hypothetical protein
MALFFYLLEAVKFLFIVMLSGFDQLNYKLEISKKELKN